MFILVYKVILRFIFPPGIFIIAFIGIGTMLIIKEKKRIIKKIGILSISMGILLYFLSIGPVKDALLLSLENTYPPLNTKSLAAANAILMLGGGSSENIPVSFGEKGVPNYSALARIHETVRIYNKAVEDGKRLPIILSGGSLLKNRKPAAEIYANHLKALNIDPKDIILEKKSRTTYENAHYSMEIIDKMGIDAIILVTSASHMTRSVETFEKYDISIIPAPCDYLSSRNPITFFTFLPSTGDLMYTGQALWEHIGRVYYSFKQ